MALLSAPFEPGPELAFAMELARHAGREILMPAVTLGKHGESEMYKGARDLVTRHDREVERFLKDALKAQFPDIAFYAEEETREELPESGARWIVDPIDGTTNFVHGHPFFAVSIGLERELGEIVLGAVYAPYLDEMFFAERGKGAYLNSTRIRLAVSDTAALTKAVLATGFAYDLEGFPNLANWCRLIHETRGLRRCGSAAIDLCHVACGRHDGFWELGLSPYDVAGGAVIVREAGGRVTDFEGGPDWLFGKTIVATNGRLHEAIRARLDPFVPRPDASPPDPAP